MLSSQITIILDLLKSTEKERLSSRDFITVQCSSQPPALPPSYRSTSTSPYRTLSTSSPQPHHPLRHHTAITITTITIVGWQAPHIQPEPWRGAGLMCGQRGSYYHIGSCVAVKDLQLQNKINISLRVLPGVRGHVSALPLPASVDLLHWHSFYVCLLPPLFILASM